MKDIIIFTFSYGKENIPEKLEEAGINLKKVLIISKKEELQEKFKTIRPKIILIDGKLSNDLFSDCIDIVEQAISDFDMDTRICTFEEDKKTPGTVFLENFAELKVFYNSIY